MTAYAPHYTARLRQKYSVQGSVHSINVRFPGPITGSGLTDAQNALFDFLSELQNILFDDWAIGQTSAADIDSTIFLPQTTVGTITGTVVTTSREEEEKATALTFVARSGSGNPMKLSVFGAAISGLESAGLVNYRFYNGENASIDAAVAVLNANSTALIGNDGQALTWYPYVNYKDYDHWVKKVRG